MICIVCIYSRYISIDINNNSNNFDTYSIGCVVMLSYRRDKALLFYFVYFFIFFQINFISFAFLHFSQYLA